MPGMERFCVVPSWVPKGFENGHLLVKGKIMQFRVQKTPQNISKQKLVGSLFPWETNGFLLSPTPPLFKKNSTQRQWSCPPPRARS
jgi:hypothetical protein